MQRIIFIFIGIFLFKPSIGQIEVKSYANFVVVDDKISWSNIYERPGKGQDSLKSLVYKSILTENSFQLISNSEEKLITQMKEEVFELRGNRINGIVTFYFKEGKYKTVMSDIIFLKGEKAIQSERDVSFFLGVPPTNSDGFRMEDGYLNKKGSFLKLGYNWLDKYNRFFRKKFDFNFTNSKGKDDW